MYVTVKNEQEDFHSVFHVMCLLGSSVVTCDKPTHVTNGRSSWSFQDRPKYGETIQYLCNEGYTLIGKEKLVCTETGKYDSQPPECKGQSRLGNPSAEESACGRCHTVSSEFQHHVVLVILVMSLDTNSLHICIVVQSPKTRLVTLEK